MASETYFGRNNEKLVTLPKMIEGGVDAVFFAVFNAQGPRTEEHMQWSLRKSPLKSSQGAIDVSGLSCQIEYWKERERWL
ncbi:MAG: hypothetical protein JXB23_18475 [Candidatus Aminicenantes bacterium]|nr:hypothetical protein [Candidatus Aminicenantes bacterium]